MYARLCALLCLDLADEYLQVTHDCSMMNQPRLLASSVSGESRTVNFELPYITNLSRSGNRYTHEMHIEMPAPDTESVAYVGIADGVEGELTVDLWRIEPNPGVSQ